MEKYIAKLFHPNGKIDMVHPRNGKTFELDELQSVVGGYIQVIHPRSSENSLMVINEEGKLKGLPYNELATKLWLYEGDLTEFGVGKVTIQGMLSQIPIPSPQDFLVGPVLLCHTSQMN
jgi:hypothetical protein